jgi:hypothetical protein
VGQHDDRPWEGPGEQWRGRLGKEGRGEKGKTAWGDERNNDNVNIAAIAVVTTTLNCRVKGWQLETRCPIEDYFKL